MELQPQLVEDISEPGPALLEKYRLFLNAKRLGTARRMLGVLFNLELTRFLAVEFRPSVRFVRLPVFVNWTAFQPIDIVESCGDASAAVPVVLSIKLTFLIWLHGKHSHITSATNERGTHKRSLTSTSISKTPRLSVRARLRGRPLAGSVILRGRPPPAHCAMKEVCLPLIKHPAGGEAPEGRDSVDVRSAK